MNKINIKCQEKHIPKSEKMSYNLIGYVTCKGRMYESGREGIIMDT